MSQPVLEPAEEVTLAQQARCGDQAARAALIMSGMRSVALRARLFGLQGEELRDAVQSGAVGLIRAVDRFDPDRGVRLATYAWRWIGAEMTRTSRPEVPLGDADRPIDECPVFENDLLAGLADEAQRVLSLRFGLGDDTTEPMTRGDVGDRLGMTVSQVRTIEGKAMRQVRVRLAKVVDRAPLQREADPP